MPKIKLTLNKTSQTKLNRFYKQLIKRNEIFSDKDFQERLKNIIQYDVKYISECTEKSIIDTYLTCADGMFLETIPSETDWNSLKTTVRNHLAGKYTNKTFDNNIDIYFNDVKREYINHPQVESNDLDFLPENRDIFIKNNLKLVVSVAKRYQNLGLPFEDLIQIGNCGLLKAFEKFDNTRSKLRKSIIDDIESFEREDFTNAEACEIIEKNFTYDNLLPKTLAKIPADGFESKSEFISWVKTNIKTAVFASVAFMWIRGYIMQELNQYSSIVRFPKKSVKPVDDTVDENDISEDSISKTIIRLDSINPYTDDCYNDKELAEISNEEFAIEDSYMSNTEREELFKDVIENVLIKLPALDRRIIKKKFGIDYPYAMNNQEIAENERISANEVKYSITKTLQFLAKEISPEMKNTIIEMFT